MGNPAVSVDNLWMDFSRFFPQGELVPVTESGPHPERGGGIVPDVGLAGYCPQYPQALLRLRILHLII
jgi:hypothetical protein